MEKEGLNSFTPHSTYSMMLKYRLLIYLTTNLKKEPANKPVYENFIKNGIIKPLAKDQSFRRK